jgi:hypothetical protein
MIISACSPYMHPSSNPSYFLVPPRTRTLSLASCTNAISLRVRHHPLLFYVILLDSFFTNHLIFDALDLENGTPFVVAGSGKPLRQFVFSHDLAKMFIWQLREYDDVEPIIFSVGEDDDVSIRYVAEQIVKAFDFQGEVRVCPLSLDVSVTLVLTNGFTSVRHEQV